MSANYTPHTWVDGSLATPLDAARLNELEAGVVAVDNAQAARQPALVPTAVKTTAYTAAVGDLVPVDLSSANVTVTLPAAPADKAQVAVKVVTPGSSKTLTVSASGSDVFDKTAGPTTLTYSLINQGAILQYKASTAIWYVISEYVPLSGLDGRYVASVGAGDSSITVGGTVSNPTIAVASATLTAKADDSAVVHNSLVTAKGDLVAASGSGLPRRLAVGTNGQVLTADSTAAVGVKWATASSGTATAGTFNVKDVSYGAVGDGVTDDTTAINAAVTAASAAGGGTVFFPPGTYLVSTPVVGRDKVRFMGAGQTLTILKASASFAPTVSDGGGLIQWQGSPFDSSPSQPIYTYVGVSDLTINMASAPDTVTNQINAIWQDYSQLRNCLIERVSYIGAKNGQCILLNGLGRITGGNSYDITIRDITATNGAGTVSLYLNSVTDGSASYHGVTIENIWNEITTISGIVDDRICIAGGQVSDAGSLATVHDINISNIKIVIQTGATVTGLVNGVKIDTGKAVTIRNITIRDVYMWGNGSTTVSGHPIITFLGAQTGTLGGLQDILIDGVYAWHTCGIAVKWRRVDTAPSVIIRNVHLNGVVTGSTGWPFGIMLYCLSVPVGDENVLIKGVSMDASSGSMCAFGLTSDTPTSGTAHGASGSVVIADSVARSFATGISLALSSAGTSASQSGWDNLTLENVTLVSYSTAASLLSKTYRSSNVTGVADTMGALLPTTAGNLIRAASGAWVSGTITGLKADLSVPDGYMAASGESTVPRTTLISTSALVSGSVQLTFFTARKTETITQVRVCTGTTAAAATPTLVRFGIYSEDAGTGDLTLVANVANDTTLFATANTEYTKSLASSWSKVAGNRYAFAVIIVTGAALPTLIGPNMNNSAVQGTILSRSPRLAGAQTGQTDLQSTIANGSITFPAPRFFYAEMLP